MAALSELVAEGWIIARERKGYQICETLPDTFFQVKVSSPKTLEGQTFPWRLNPTLEDHYSLDHAPAVKYPFKSGSPDLRTFPYSELKTIYSDVLRHPKGSFFEYGDPSGHPALLKQLTEYLRRTRNLVGKTLITTHGSQEGIFLVAHLLLRPQDRVAVESLGYRPAWNAFRSTGAELVPIATEADGMNIEALERVLEQKKIHLIYTTPLHQYPTTHTLSIPKRLKLYELAARYKVPILEDDYDHEFHYDCQPLPPLASDDPHHLVLYISTFSKVLFPEPGLAFWRFRLSLLNPLFDCAWPPLSTIAHCSRR